MEPITSGLLTNLLAAGLLNRVEAGRQHLHAVFREAEFHAELDAIETEFHKSLCDAIEDGAAEQELDDFADIVEHWDAVIERLDATAAMDGEVGPATDRLVFESEREAVDRLAREIGAVCGYDLETNPQLQQALKRAVAEAYREAVGSFAERLVDAGLDEQFVAEANIEELGALDQLQDRLADLEERLTHPRFYELYRGDAAGRRQASRMIDPQALEFVSRPELEDRRTAQRLLVLGPGGSGKSRVLADLVANANPAIAHIIRPKAALQNSQDLQPLRSESFQGDVLLVWDDIHAISPERDNTVFRKAIFELEEFLAPEHELHVFAAARSNRMESLPGEIERTGSPLWSTFETVELGELSEEAIATLFDRVLAKEGVVASEEVRTAFVEKAQTTDPSPLYVTSVVETVDGVQLTTEDIEVLPEDALTIWQEQYEAINAANDERRFVLWAVKLLAEFGNLSGYHRSLLKGIYAHVLDRDELTFDPPVKKLCQHQWLVPRADAHGETAYVVHDVKTEAIDESIEGRLRAYSTFLFEDVDKYLPTTGNIEHWLHENYAAELYNISLPWIPQVRKQHHERSITLSPECTAAHYNYANLLQYEYDAVEEAKEHYEEALAIDPEDAQAHYNHANLLQYEYDAVEEAKEHYEESLALDPEDAQAHYNYANLLKTEYDVVEEAKEHYEEGLALDPKYAQAHTNYAVLLADAYDAVEEAKEHYEEALAIDPENPNAYYSYANLLKNEYDAVEEAKEHYEEALALDPEFARAHTNYAILLREECDAVEEAKAHYEEALAINSDLDPAHHHYAHLLEGELDASEEAKEHYEEALAIDPEDGEHHCCYGTFLIDELDAPAEAKAHYEQALQLFEDVNEATQVLSALYGLVRVYRAVDDDGMALEYCERALAISPDDPTKSRWFEGVHALLTESDCRTRYIHGLTAVCDEHRDLSRALFEQVWTNQDGYPPTSESNDITLAAGVMLAACPRDDGDDSQTAEEILSYIEPSSLSSPIRLLYESLDGGPTDSLAVSSTDEPLEELSLEMLERQAVAHLLDRSED